MHRFNGAYAPAMAHLQMIIEESIEDDDIIAFVTSFLMTNELEFEDVKPKHGG